jgi:hypothetical protein
VRDAGLANGRTGGETDELYPNIDIEPRDKGREAFISDTVVVGCDGMRCQSPLDDRPRAKLSCEMSEGVEYALPVDEDGSIGLSCHLFGD